MYHDPFSNTFNVQNLVKADPNFIIWILQIKHVC